MIKYTCGAGTPEEAETNCTYFIRGECTSSFCEYRRKKQTNADRINAMTIEEKAEFLSNIAYGRETPWSYRFIDTFCKECTTVRGTYKSGVEDDFHECDFTDGKCPHGSDIVWWLQQPYNEVEQ